MAVVDANVVEVWSWTAPFDLTGLDHLLDRIERDRRVAYRRRVDADRFAAAAILLRCAVADPDTDPTTICIDRTCETCGRPHGRPRIPTIDREVSVTHGGRVVAVAVTRGTAVGVDVEPLGSLDLDAVATACAPEERPAIVDSTGFARVWTRKEALLKALGTGLRTDPATLLVSPPGEPPRAIRLAGGPPPPCTLVDLDWPPDHVGALALLGETRPVVVHRSAADLVDPHRAG